MFHELLVWSLFPYLGKRKTGETSHFSFQIKVFDRWNACCQHLLLDILLEALFPCRCELFAFSSVPSTKSLAFFAFPLSFALSESVSVDSFPNDERRRLFCSLACWQALYRPWLFEAISKAFSLASYASFFGMASLLFGEDIIIFALLSHSSFALCSLSLS